MPLNKEVSFKEYENILFKHFNKKYWKKDSFNIAYFLRLCISNNNGAVLVDLTDNKDGTIKTVKLLRRLTIKNFDKTIKLWFEINSDDMYVNHL